MNMVRIKKTRFFCFTAGGLSWWNYRETAILLQREYHVLLPILDGHAGSDRSFTTIEENASEIISFIDAHLGGSVLLIGGLSLGGQVLLEMLSQRRDICSYALVESAAVIPSKRISSGDCAESAYRFGGLIQTDPRGRLPTAASGDFSFSKIKAGTGRFRSWPTFDPYGNFYRKTAGLFPGSAALFSDE